MPYALPVPSPTAAALAVAIVLLCPPPARTEVLTVLPDGGGPFATIQDALAAAGGGDVVELGDGVFTGPGNVDFFQWIAFSQRGDTLTIRSAGGDPAACVVDGGGDGSFWIDGRISLVIAGLQFRGLTFATGDMGPTPNPQLDLRVGGTIFRHCGVDLQLATVGVFTDCLFEDTGVFSSVDATFRRCRFADHHNPNNGGAVLAWGGLTVEDCVFSGNSAGGLGGAICQTGDWLGLPVRVTGSVFVGNTAGEAGGAIAITAYVNQAPSPLAVNGCTFYGGDAPRGGAVAAAGAVAMERCIIAATGGGEPLACETTGSFALACCDLFGNAGGNWVGCVAGQDTAAGNAAADPCFCAPESGDFTLCADSWCLPGAHPAGCEGPVGALGRGCEACSCVAPVPSARRSWGGMRALFR